MYLDGGLEPVRKFVRKLWVDIMKAQALPPKDSKTALQEWLLTRGLPLPVYELVSQEGPSHTPVFIINVKAQNMEGQGKGGSKRSAQSAAAKDLLGKLNKVNKIKRQGNK